MAILCIALKLFLLDQNTNTWNSNNWKSMYVVRTWQTASCLWQCRLGAHKSI